MVEPSSSPSVDRDTIDEYLTTMGPLLQRWPEEDKKRQELVATGPRVLIPVFEAAVAQFGVVTKRRSPRTEALVNHVLRMVFERTLGVVRELLQVDATTSAMSSVEIARALGHRDLDVRRLAAAMCLNRGLYEGVLIEPLKAAASQEDALLGMLACAAIGGLDSVDLPLRLAAREVLRKAMESADAASMAEGSGVEPIEDPVARAVAYLALQVPFLIGTDRLNRTQG